MLEIKIGTRGSPLALAQTEIIKREILSSWPDLTIKVIPIKTSGDKNMSPFLKTNNNKGMFTFEIENALLNHEIDFAVHSLKDLPVKINPDLPVIAYSRRGNPFDALIGIEGVIGSSSLRRRLQLEKLFPDSKIIPVRGNINTRINKLDSGEFSLTGLVLACAGLERLGLENRITKIFNEDEIMPAPGQGILACQGRKNENYFYLDTLNNKISGFCAMAERSFSCALNAGCNVPVGAYAKIVDDRLTLKGLYIDENNKKFYRGEISGNFNQAEELGKILAKEIFIS